MTYMAPYSLNQFDDITIDNNDEYDDLHGDVQFKPI